MAQALQRFAWLVVFVALAPIAGAQDSGPKNVKKQDPPEKKEKVSRSKRKQSTLVDVYLTNDEKVRGIIKDGRYIEVPQGVGFRPSNRNNLQAGIRVWHVAGAESFIFIHYTSVRSYRVVRTLSELEVREIASKARQEARAKAEEARKEALRRLAERQLMQQERALMRKLDNLAEAEVEVEAQRKENLGFVELLRAFPPADGWSPSKIVDIRRRISVDLFPTPKEKEFIRRYDDWRPAYQWWAREGRARYGDLERASGELQNPLGGAKKEPSPKVPPKVPPRVPPKETGKEASSSKKSKG